MPLPTNHEILPGMRYLNSSTHHTATGLRASLWGWLLLVSFSSACQEQKQQVPQGPTAAGQPGHWEGQPATPASAEQRVGARLVPFLHQGRYGLMTPAGKVVVPAHWTRMPQPFAGYRLWLAEAEKDALLPVVLLSDSGAVLGHYQTVSWAPGRWGWVQAIGARRTITLYDSLGRLIRATRYAKLEEPRGGLMVVALPDTTGPSPRGGSATVEGRRGMIDPQGHEVVPPRYDYLQPYEHGYAHMGMRGQGMEQGPMGVLNRQGREHWLRPEWTKLRPVYRGGFYTVRTEDQQRMQALDVDGNVLVPYSAGFVDFTREYADWTGLVKVKRREQPAPGHWRETWGLADSLLRPLLPPAYERIDAGATWSILYAFDLAWPNRSPGYGDPKKGVAWRGHLLLPAEYNYVEVSKDQRFVLAGAYSPTTRSWRYLTSELGRPPQPFSDVQTVRYVGHGVFAVQRNNRWGLMRANGQVLRPCVDENPTEELQQGLYYSRSAGRWGPELADTLGRTVLAAGNFQSAGFFSPTLAWVKQNDKYGVIEPRTGKQLLPPVLEELPTMRSDGTFWAQHDGQALIGSATQPLLTIKDANFKPYLLVGPNLVLGTRSGIGSSSWALYNRQGQLLSTEIVAVENAYANGLKAFRNGVAWAKNKQSRYALIDVKGQLLTPFKFQLVMDLNENVFPFYAGIAIAKNEAGQWLYVDCLGREYAW